jgi:hypothetical protein
VSGVIRRRDGDNLARDHVGRNRHRSSHADEAATGNRLDAGVVCCILSLLPRVATLAEWVSAIPGLLVVLALFLLFGVPTWIVLVGRSRVVVDLRQGYILKVDDLLFYQRTRTFPIDQVHDVRVKSKTLRISRHSSQTYEIQLHLTGHKPITIGCEDIVWDAHEVARRLRDLLRIGASETPA